MTMEPNKYDFIIEQGATLYIPFAVDSEDGATVLDLAAEGDGYTFGTLDILDYHGGTSVLAEPLTTSNGGIVIDYFTDTSGTWSGYWFISAADTAELTDWGEGVYTFEIADSDGPTARKEHPLFGTVSLNMETTI